MPPDALHREDHGVWITLVEAFCQALKDLYPSSRKRKRRAEDGTLVETEEAWSDKIDQVNERLAGLAVEGRWEAFNIPCHGEYLPKHPCVQVRLCAPMMDCAHARVCACPRVYVIVCGCVCVRAR
jgi:hypothetical protein